MNPHGLYNKEDGPCCFTAVAYGGQKQKAVTLAVRALGLALLFPPHGRAPGDSRAGRAGGCASRRDGLRLSRTLVLNIVAGQEGRRTDFQAAKTIKLTNDF